MGSQPVVSVVIPNWNAKALIDRCLDSFAGQTLRDFEVIVVDNGSSDDSVDFIRERHPLVRVVALPLNKGFAGGVNEGIRVARGELVAILNNDAVPEPDWLSFLVEKIMSSDRFAACMPKLLRTSRTDASVIDSTGDFYSVWGIPFSRGRDELDDVRYESEGEVFSASGAASLFRASALREVGLFDEDFFAYYEDVDLSFRLRLAGYSIAYQPRAVVHHEVGSTSGGGATAFTRYHAMKNLWFLYVKNMPAPLFWKYLPKFLAGQALMVAGSIRKRLFLPHVRAIIANVVRTPSILVRRRKIQRSRVASSAEIDLLLLKTLPPQQRATLRQIFRLQ